MSSDPPVYGPAWRGWESYRQFAESVKSELRYVRSKETTNFLDEVLGSCKGRELVIPPGKTFWRARLGCESEEVTDTDGELSVTYDRDRPYSRDGMKPIANWQNEGRANPRGIPYLYLATTRETALAEVRPWIGATISVARLRIRRDLKVIDCSKHHSTGSLIDIIFMDDKRPREDGIWTAIDQAFATPVNRDDESKDYIPTQVIAELFKSVGYDGIVYKSRLAEDGFNLALFKLDVAGVEQCGLFTVDSISFGFTETGTEYFTDPA